MLVDLQTPIELAPLELPSSAPWGLSHMCKYETLDITCNAWGAKSIMMHDHEQPKHISS
jgi:hypothetical protein